MKKLILLTDVYPYGNAEKTFVESEIEALSKEYDITIVSAAPKDYFEKYKANRKDVKDGINVLWYPGINGFLKLAYYILFFFHPVGWEEIRDIKAEKSGFFLKIKKAMFTFMEGYAIFTFLKKSGLLDENEEFVIYSFWLTRLALCASFVKKICPKAVALSRVHGYDLYNERCRDTKRQPLKKCMDRRLDGVLFISDMARDYYIEHFSTDNPKIRYFVARLGSPKCFDELPGKGSDDIRKDEFILASCSVIIPLKRLELIIDALSLIEGHKIKWVHFGEGSLKQEIEAYAESKLSGKPNISYEFKGFVLRDRICEFYGSGNVGAFITTSETEGLPVSIMEAMSCGIPIISTNVGGISEMIDKNGILMSSNPAGEEVSRAILKIVELPTDEYANMRNASFEIWQRDYDSVENARKVAGIFDNSFYK